VSCALRKKTAAPANGTTGEVNILTYCTVSAMGVVWIGLPEVAVLGNSVLVRAFCIFSSFSSAYRLLPNGSALSGQVEE
jgi:hypothetical protein